MRYAVLAALAFFLVWLIWGGTLYLRVQAGNAPIRIKIRFSLGVLPLFSYRWQLPDAKAEGASFADEPRPPEAAAQSQEEKPTGGAADSEKRQKKQAKRHSLAKKRIRAALWFYQRGSLEQLSAQMDIGLADNAALTALLCAAAYSAIGALVAARENAATLRNVKITPHFDADVFRVAFSCIISLRLRHIIVESFKLIKEATKWGRTLSKT
ncbi:MAG: DUF2953 domain-containing protein [Eubacteriales bacterium]|nr:DUF2953 domain-containing protein [Eubacteriales bacterium]